MRISVNTFAEQSAKLLATIKGSTGSFSIPEIETFMESVNCQTLKAKSTSKTDIRIVIHDQRINQTAELGFSIKSQLGGEATLLNAGKSEANTGVPVAIASNRTIPNDSPPKFGAT